MKSYNILLLFFIISSNSLATSDFFINGKQGWFYYKEDKKKNTEINTTKEEQKRKDEEFMKSIPIHNLDSLSAEQFKKMFKKAKEIAVMHPTKENVSIVQAMNKWQMEQSEKFARVWAVNMMENPNLEYPNIAKDKFSSSVEFHKKEKEKNEFFKNHKDDLGYVMFYSMSDPYAFKKEKNVLDNIKHFRGITIEYVDIAKRPDLAKRFKIMNNPEIFFVYKNKKGQAVWMRVKSGMATQEEIENNTMFLFKNAILEKDK